MSKGEMRKQMRRIVAAIAEKDTFLETLDACEGGASGVLQGSKDKNIAIIPTFGYSNRKAVGWG